MNRNESCGEKNRGPAYVPRFVTLIASPFFFVKKKDSKLYPVQDYYKLNQRTIKNKYPLLLIQEFINKTKQARYFTKLNVCWGYNNI